MIQTILLPATGSDTDTVIFEAALGVARQFSAHLTFLHVRTDRAGVDEAMAAAGSGALMIPGELMEQAEREAEQREIRAKEQFRSFCDREKLVTSETPPASPAVSVQWCREIGPEAALVVEHGQASDLLVVGRPNGDMGVSPGTLQAALFETGRPLLIPASGAASRQSPAETIAIAWKPTAPAARAVSAAMPFLIKSKHIVIMTVGEGNLVGAQSAAKIAATLRWHRLEVSACHLPPGTGSAADILFAAARESGADLVVMGGYGHSRTREFVFGGFTEQVLRSADLPVLMCH